MRIKKAKLKKYKRELEEKIWILEHQNDLYRKRYFEHRQRICKLEHDLRTNKILIFDEVMI